MARQKYNPLPGFGLTMGYTLLYLSVLVIIPIAGLFLKASQLSWRQFWQLVTDDRALASYKLTFGASFAAAFLNAILGTLLAWILVRYQFWGKRFIDALVDFPFALPTAVAGLALSSLFGQFDKGVLNLDQWLGHHLYLLFGQFDKGVLYQLFPGHEYKISYTPIAITIALTFVGLPFVVRTLQPVLANLEQEVEEAAATLGASRLRTFCSILAPTIFPTVVTGFALAFARAVGEYGSIVFVSNNMPYKMEIAPQLIVMQLDQYNYAGATAIAAVLLIISFVILALINWLEVWASRFSK